MCCDKNLFTLKLENWHPSAFSDDYICIHMLIYRQDIIAVWYLYFRILFAQLCLKYGLYYLKIWYIWRCKDWNVSDAQIVKFAPKCLFRQQYLHLSPIVQGRSGICIPILFSPSFLCVNLLDYPKIIYTLFCRSHFRSQIYWKGRCTLITKSVWHISQTLSINKCLNSTLTSAS